MNRRHIIVLSSLISICYSAAYTAISPSLLSVAGDLDVEVTTASLLFTANCTGFILFTLAASTFLTRVPRKMVLLCSLLGFAVSQLLFAVSGSFWMAGMAMLCMGGFQGILQSCLMAVIIEVSGERKDFFVNLNMAFYGIGSLIGPIAVSFCLSHLLGWRGYYGILGLVTIVLAALFAPVSVTDPAAVPEQALSERRLQRNTWNLGIILICVCLALECGAEVSSWGWMSTFLQEDLHFSVEKSGFAVGIFGAGLVAGRLLCGQLSKWIAPRRLIEILSFASVVTVVVGSLVEQEILVLLFVVLMGFSFSSLWPFLISFGSERIIGQGDGMLARIIVSGSVGSAVIPYFLGLASEHIGVRVTRMLPAVLFAVIWMVFRFVFPRTEKGMENKA